MKSTRFDHPPDPNRKPFRLIVLILWAVVLAAVCVRVSVQKKSKHAAAPGNPRRRCRDPAGRPHQGAGPVGGPGGLGRRLAEE